MSETFLNRVKNEHESLSETERYLIDYMKQHINAIPQISIVKLSEQANVSTATIVRTMQKLGYSGFTAFKIHLKDEFDASPAFSAVEKIDKEIKEAILKNEQEVIKTIELLDSGTIEDALQKIIHSNKITIFARGFSELIAKEMMVKFQLLGKSCELHDDPNIIRTISKKIDKRNIVIFVSLNGKTEELVEAASNCQKNAVSTILLTANQNSPLYELCEISLVGFKSKKSYFPDYEVRSRLPIQVIARIILDAYAIRM
ncbi:MurR/RpiR family transcriptional regulator [Lentibacillus daqui]|uniref:MurR/RpiR family transcriptional regulator n=1 Tax=Lentibacillus daqui TaxID=2911514 RepID=UPI0022B1E368|nr:MurR/RpiR family transcriptional regulator [Lentibacillus daqui]